MGIGDAIGALRAGHRVRRKGWNGTGMWLAYVNGDDWGFAMKSHPMDEKEENRLVQPSLPFIVMRTSDGRAVPWLCDQTSLLANDWEILK